MKHRFVIPEDLPLGLLVGLISLAPYFLIFAGFFQQDEWLGYGRSITLFHDNLVSLLTYAFAPSAGRYNPLSLLGVFFAYRTFGLDYNLFVALSLVLHFFVVLLVFSLAVKIFNDKRTAFICALLFGTMAASYQTTSWVVANIATHTATIFALSSTIYFFKFLQEKSKEFLYASLILLIISLLFKEIAIGLLVLFPFAVFLFLKGARDRRKVLYLFLLVSFLYLTVRIVFIVLAKDQPLSDSVSSRTGEIKTVYNLITLPFKSTTQTLVPGIELKGFAERISYLFPTKITGEKGTPTFDKFVIKRTLEGISITFFFGFIIFFFYSIKRDSNGYSRKIKIFSLAWIITNSFIFALTPEKNAIISLVDSRNLYFISVGMALLVTSFFADLRLRKLMRYGNLAVFIIIFLNIYWLQKELGGVIELGRLRKNILMTITKKYNNLPSTVVFYTESDNSYYGLPEEIRILPFQSGFGQTLLSFYQAQENFPKEFFANRFLWEITDQGYKRVGDRAFGYFRDFETLTETLKKEGLGQDSVYSFNWDSEAETLKDNTQEVRGRIEGFFAKKTRLNLAPSMLTTSQNQEDSYKMVDRIPNTSWSSLIPYSNILEINVDLGMQVMVAEVDINSYNDRNQNGVGYQILASSDGKVWKEMFWNKKYPPNDKGVDKIYFKPTNTQYLKIKQIGFHKFAPWVVSEIEVFRSF